MKKQITIFSIFVFLICSNLAFSQLSFGVHTGYGTKSAYLGLKNKTHFMPYLSLQSASLRITDDYDGDTEKVKLGIIMPTIGTKYYLKDNGKLKPYLDLTISKPIFYANPADEFESLNLWAGSAGIGTEYFLDPQFSLGGEFGFTYLHGNYDESYRSYTNNGNYVTETETIKISGNPTYARISLNFYFNKKE
ncbi:MAG: hypothetical protein LCH67_02215 [Bacteroidetes bacterium]|nr:hypothetical protein [Bacteroidota bacterium]